MRPTSQLTTAALAMAACWLPPLAAAAVAQPVKCYEWTEAAPIVAREKLVSAAEVHRQARTEMQGELIRITLCEEGGDWIYRIVVQKGGGKVENRTVNARKPFPR